MMVLTMKVQDKFLYYKTPEPDNIKIFNKVIKTNKPIWENLEPLGTTKEQFLSYPVPTDNIEMPENGKELGVDLMYSDDNGLSTWTTRRLDFVTLDGYKPTITNALVYNPMSHMAWHTNSNVEGYRHYYTFSTKQSIFRWKCPITSEINNEVDSVGWTYRVFKITKEQLLWHTIWSEGIRFAFGFNTPPDRT